MLKSHAPYLASKRNLFRGHSLKLLVLCDKCFLWHKLWHGNQTDEQTEQGHDAIKKSEKGSRQAERGPDRWNPKIQEPVLTQMRSDLLYFVSSVLRYFSFKFNFGQAFCD